MAWYSDSVSFNIFNIYVIRFPTSIVWYQTEVHSFLYDHTRFSSRSVVESLLESCNVGCATRRSNMGKWLKKTSFVFLFLQSLQ